MPLLNPADGRPVHLMGIAGAGMNALAELLLREGATVSGCDLNPAGCDNLIALGAVVLRGHAAEHVAGARAVIVSSAVPRDHPEVLAAAVAGIPVIRRAEALAELVQRGLLVGIAGTHGKTTTTVMTTMALEAASLRPTGVAGGKVGMWGGNLRPGSSELFVVEADEYDRSFLALRPDVAVVTNIEADHLDIYTDLADIRAAFSEYASRARTAILCGDDAGAASLPIEPGVRRIAYGAGRAAVDTCDLVAQNVTPVGSGSAFDLWSRETGGILARVELAVPGIHNVRNALAALASGVVLGADAGVMAEGLRKFSGVERRFEMLGDAKGITFVDDYAHHPTEIAATLAAAREVFPGRRIVCAFQPHLFSRTRDFAPEFGAALAAADSVFLTEIYPAREKPIHGVTSTLVEDAIRVSGGRVAWRGERAGLASALRAELRPGDVAITAGAGDVTHVGRELLAALRSEV